MSYPFGMNERQVVWFAEVGVADVPRVGGKNASLGELITALSSEGVRVPDDGFAATADAYRSFVAHNGLEEWITAEPDAYRRGASASAFAGEASDHRELAKVLVEHGSGSISLNPKRFLRTASSVAELEAGASIRLK